jgi:ADP-ribose pyrophosphatase YjhB (NUDIX family)
MTDNNNENYCNNCGKYGHLYHQCKTPITSFGVIVFRMNEGVPEYLMIRRKDTLGYIDFLRGKYSVYNKYYIMNMLKQMTFKEKEKIKINDFDTLWKELWGNISISNQYKTEEIVSKEKYKQLCDGILTKSDYYTLHDLLEESNNYSVWTEPEWGFPKGRRDYKETDYDCAMREFTEETGYSIKRLKNIQNILPFEENFTGSNYKSYKHKYYLMYMKYDDTMVSTNFQKDEVSKMSWKKYEDCISCIRPYNLEKIRLITNINNALNKYSMCSN